MKLLHGVKPVYVEWIDSMHTPGWMLKAETSDMRCATVGDLIRREKDRIVIGQSRSKEGYAAIIEIPLFAIKRIRRLKV